MYTPKLNLQPVDVCENIDRALFTQRYLKSNTPVVMKNYSKDWAAKEKWSFDYFKSRYPELMVPVYGEAFADTGKSYTSTDDKMLFGDYLDLIAAQPTQLRMFLFNIFKHIPDLCQDFTYPDIIDAYVKKHPFMFFGGATSKVDAHYDLDLSHVFLTQFQGRKRVVLFGPEYSTHLYRHPLTVSCNIDLGNPDFAKYPKLLEAKGYECEINNGETLFIPSGYWHYIYYIEGGFALSLRARTTRISRLTLAGFKMFNLLVVDYNMSRLLGAKRWYAMKEQLAIKRAMKLK
jgi:hypothetical protein